MIDGLVACLRVAKDVLKHIVGRLLLVAVVVASAASATSTADAALTLFQIFNDPSPAVRDGFGRAVALSGNHVLINGTSRDSINGTLAGQALLFDATTGALLQTFNDPNPSLDDGFGSTVALSGNRILIGASSDDTNGTDAGQAFLFASTTTFTSLLPTSRAGMTGDALTAFFAAFNAGSIAAVNCVISPATAIPAAFVFQTTKPGTNQLTGAPDRAVTIAAGSVQTFVVSFTLSAPFAATEVAFDFHCDNTEPVSTIAGVNTFVLSGFATPVPDIVALAATTSNDGIVHVAGPHDTHSFAVASVNVGGAAFDGEVSVNTGANTDLLMEVDIQMCQTEPSTGTCTTALGRSVAGVHVGAGETPTFAIFVRGVGRAVALNPATRRVFVTFEDSAFARAGSTSVALEVAAGSP